jgi:hypothetical protein
MNENVINIENVSIEIEEEKDLVINLEDFLTDSLINEFIELFTTISTLLGDLRLRTLKLLKDKDNNDNKSPITAPILKLSFDYLGKIVDKFHSDEGAGDLIENVYNTGYLTLYLSIPISILINININIYII